MQLGARLRALNYKIDRYKADYVVTEDHLIKLVRGTIQEAKEVSPKSKVLQEMVVPDRSTAGALSALLSCASSEVQHSKPQRYSSLGDSSAEYRFGRQISIRKLGEKSGELEQKPCSQQ